MISLLTSPVAPSHSEQKLPGNSGGLRPQPYVPANSQIIGQIAHSAGIEAILYPSAKTEKNALAIFPENFNNSDSFVEIVGAVAETVIHTRIDKDSYRNFLP